MNTLDELLSVAADDIRTAVEQLPIRQRRVPPAREPHKALTLLAAAAILATAVGVAFVVTRDDTVSVSGPPTIDVHHARIEVILAAQLECETQIDTAGTFATMVVDSYSDRSGKQWRTQVTYPDGSTVDFITKGSAIYPTEAFQRGDYRGSEFGCIGPQDESFILVTEPYRGGSFFTLNLSEELAPDEGPFVRGLWEMSTRIDGDHIDSLGRPSELWEYRNEGGSAGYGSVADLDITQVSSWWVDETDSHTVLEHRFSNTVETLGSATQTSTLVTNESIDVSIDFFDTTGYEEQETFPRPSLDGSGTGDTIATETTVSESDPAMPLQLASAPAGLQLVGQGVRSIGAGEDVGCQSRCGENVRAAVFIKRDAQGDVIERTLVRVGDLSLYAGGGSQVVAPPNLAPATSGSIVIDQQGQTVRVEYALGPLGNLTLDAYHPDELTNNALSAEMQQIASALDVGVGHDIGVVAPLPNGWTLATVGREPENSVPSFYQAFEVDSSEGGPRIMIDNRMLDDPDYPYWVMSQTLQSAEIRGHSGFVTTHHYFDSTDPNTAPPNNDVHWTILIWEETPGLWVTMWVANTTTDAATALAHSLVAVEQADWPQAGSV